MPKSGSFLEVTKANIVTDHFTSSQKVLPDVSSLKSSKILKSAKKSTLIGQKLTKSAKIGNFGGHILANTEN